MGIIGDNGFGGGSGSGTGFTGIVDNYAALPAAAGASGQLYYVRTSTGLFWNQRSGSYYSDGASWVRAGGVNLQIVDNELTFSDDGDNTRKMELQLSGITPGNTRTLTVPDASGTIALTTDIVTSHASLTNRDIAGNHEKLIPSADSTTAIQLLKADGVTPILNIDSVNNRFGLSTITPRRKADILDASAPQLRLSYSDNAVYTDLQASSAGNLVITTSGTGVRVPALGIGTLPNVNYALNAYKSQAYTSGQVGRGLSFILTDTSTVTSTHYVQGVLGVVYSELADGVNNTGYVRGGEFSVSQRKDNTNVATMDGLNISAGIYGVGGIDTTATAGTVNGLNISFLSRASGAMTMARGINITAPAFGTTGTFRGINLNATTNAMAYKYGIWLSDITGGTTDNYSIYTGLGDVRHGDDLILNGADNDKLWLGAGKDASLSYNGTNLIINPKEVGAGDLSVLGRIEEEGTFAEIHSHDNATTQSIPTGATYTKITTLDNNGENANCTADATNDKITITKTGRYLVNGSFSFSCGTNNVTFFGSAFLNDVEQNQIHWTRKIATGGDIGSASFTGIIDVTITPWDLDVRFRHDNVGDITLTLSYANINTVYLGET